MSTSAASSVTVVKADEKQAKVRDDVSSRVEHLATSRKASAPSRSCLDCCKPSWKESASKVSGYIALAAILAIFSTAIIANYPDAAIALYCTFSVIGVLALVHFATKSASRCRGDKTFTAESVSGL